MNFGNGITYGFEGIVTVNATNFWSSNLSFSLYEQDIDGSNVSEEVSNKTLSYYGKWINNFSLWKNAKLQVISNYNSPIGTPQGQKKAVYNVDIGFQQKIIKGKGGLGIVVTDIFNIQKSGSITNSPGNLYYNRTFKVDTRAVLVTFAYSFGTAFKEESVMENKFSND